MEIGVLREFATLAIVRNYSETARRLNLSQPTLSRHIAALEAELGCALVNRTLPLTLTQAGEEVLEDAQTILAAYDSMVETARVAGRSPKRIVTIQDYSFSPRAFGCISACQRAFEAENLGATFKNIECASGHTVFQMVEKGLFDIGFVHTFDDGVELQRPEVPEGMKAVRVPNLCGALAFACRKDSRMEARLRAEGSLGLADFRHVAFMSPTERYLDDFRQSFSSFCEAHGGFKPRFSFRPMHSHKYFYALDPGESAYITWSFEGYDGVSLVNGDLTAIVLGEYRFNTYAVFADCGDDDLAAEFVRALCEASEKQ